MRFKAQEVVRGATKFSGEIDGKYIKSARIFVDVSLDAEGKGFGYRTEGMKCATLELVESIMTKPFPFLAELDVEQKASRQTTELVVVGIRFISAGAPVKAAA